MILEQREKFHYFPEMWIVLLRHWHVTEGHITCIIRLITDISEKKPKMPKNLWETVLNLSFKIVEEKLRSSKD